VVMFHQENLIVRPVKMISNVRYLLKQPVQGVAYAPPR
jgi:hypothetical protein